MNTVLTIAGSDPFGGSGMQADLKTITANKVYGMTAITVVTAQNSRGFYNKQLVDPKLLDDQIGFIFQDIIPDSTKTGMILDKNQLEVIVNKIKELKPKNLIVDPIMVAQGKIRLLDEEVENSIIEELIPLAFVITPNKWETELISGKSINSKEDMIEAARFINQKFGVNVLSKSDCLGNDSDDLLYTSNGYYWLKGPKIETKNVRGTGDTLSAALACNLAKGYDLKDAAIRAKEYITNAIKEEIKVVEGRGPVNHYYNIKD